MAYVFAGRKANKLDIINSMERHIRNGIFFFIKRLPESSSIQLMINSPAIE
jgi:hypothetical protein